MSDQRRRAQRTIEEREIVEVAASVWKRTALGMKRRIEKNIILPDEQDDGHGRKATEAKKKEADSAQKMTAEGLEAAQYSLTNQNALQK